MFAVSPKKRRHLKGPGYEKLHEPMGVARVESHRDSGLAGLPMGPTIRRTGIERRAGRPLPEPDVDALAISHYGRAVPDIVKAHHEPTLGFGVDDGTLHSDFYVSPIEGLEAEASPVTPVTHIAFLADSQQAVQAFHAAALAAGGRDNGAPGPRPYHPGYYSAFVLDPDGNNIEAVVDWAHSNE